MEKKLILVVDDSIIIRSLVNKTLSDEGYEVIEAVDGEDGISICEKNKTINLIVSDVYMPNADGFEFLSSIRSMASYESVPVVMLTTESDKSKIEIGKSLGIKAWVVKPFTPKHFLNIVSTVISPN